MKVPVPASSPLSSSFSHGSGAGKGPGNVGKGPGNAGKGSGSAGKGPGPGSGGGVLENESSPKKIVLTKLSRRTKLLAYGTRTSKRY